MKEDIRNLVGMALTDRLRGEEERLLAGAIDAVGDSAGSHDCGVVEEEGLFWCEAVKVMLRDSCRGD